MNERDHTADTGNLERDLGFLNRRILNVQGRIATSETPSEASRKELEDLLSYERLVKGIIARRHAEAASGSAQRSEQGQGDAGHLPAAGPSLDEIAADAYTAFQRELEDEGGIVDREIEVELLGDEESAERATQALVAEILRSQAATDLKASTIEELEEQWAAARQAVVDQISTDYSQEDLDKILRRVDAQREHSVEPAAAAQPVPESPAPSSEVRIEEATTKDFPVVKVVIGAVAAVIVGILGVLVVSGDEDTSTPTTTTASPADEPESGEPSEASQADNQPGEEPPPTEQSAGPPAREEPQDAEAQETGSGVVIEISSTGECGQEPTPERTFPVFTLTNTGLDVATLHPTDDYNANDSSWETRNTDSGDLYTVAASFEIAWADGTPNTGVRFIRFRGSNGVDARADLFDVATEEVFPMAVIVVDGVAEFSLPGTDLRVGEPTSNADSVGLTFPAMRLGDGAEIVAIEATIRIFDETTLDECTARFRSDDVPADSRAAFARLGTAGSTDSLVAHLTWGP